ncbi:MAG: hypothetical protein LBF75_08770, partial [Treponema sp.]|nr:hypothetical protein [Treponema sp.]
MAYHYCPIGTLSPLAGIPSVFFSVMYGLIKTKWPINPLLRYMRPLRILKQGVWYEIRTCINNQEPL